MYVYSIAGKETHLWWHTLCAVTNHTATLIVRNVSSLQVICVVTSMYICWSNQSYWRWRHKLKDFRHSELICHNFIHINTHICVTTIRPIVPGNRITMWILADTIRDECNHRLKSYKGMNQTYVSKKLQRDHLNASDSIQWRQVKAP